jgi:TP901 family phage tail tape measure protein
MGSTADSITGKIGSLGSAMHTMGLVGLGVFTAVVGFFALAEKAAISYQTVLTNLQNTAALTDAQTSALGVTLENLAIGTTASANDMANAIAPVAGEIQQLTGHVLTAADATNILTAAQDIAVVKGVSLTATTKNIVDILRSYKLATSDAADVANTLVEGSDLLGISTTQLAQSFTRLQPRIVGSNMSLQDVMSTVVALGPAAGTGARAIMQVGTVIHALVEPSKAASAAMKAAGVSLYDSKGNYIGATAAIQALSVAYNKMGTEAQKTAFLQSVFGAQGKLAEQLIAGGQAGLDKATASLLANGTAAEKAALKMQDAQEQMDLLPKTINDIALPIGMVLLPSLNRFLLALTPILQGIAYWTTQNPQLAAAILGIVGALGLLTGLTVILGPALGVIGALVGSAVFPFILLGVAIGGLIYFLMQIPAVAQPVMAILHDLGDLVTGEVGDFQNLFGNISKALSGGIKGGLGTVFSETGEEMRENFMERIAPIVGEFTKLGTAISNALSGILPQIIPAVTGFVNAMVDAFSAVLPVIASSIEGIGDVIIAALPSIGKAFLGISDVLVNLTTTMVDLLTANAPRILAAVISMVQSLLDWTLNTGVPGVATAAGGFVDAFSSWVPKAAAKMIAEVPEIIAAVQKMVTMLIAFAVKNVPVIAAKVLLWGQAFVGWVQQRLPALLASLQQLGTAVLAWIVKEAPVLAAQVGQWAGAFMGWLSQTWPKALAALNSLIMSLLGWFTAVYPQIYNAALTWLQAFLGWVDQVLPGLLSAISTALSGMIDWMLNTGVPLLATAAGQLFDTLVADLPTVLGDLASMLVNIMGVLVSKVPGIIADILNALATLISAVGGFIIANAPKLIEHLAQWGLAFVGWIAPRIGGMLGNLAGMIGQLLGWIAGQVGAIAGTVAGWGLAFVEWVAGAITGLLSSLGDLIGQVLGWIVDNGPAIANQILSWVESLTYWVVMAIPYLIAILGVLADALFNWITQNGPKVLSEFAKWVPKAIQWVVTMGQQIVGKLASFIGTVIAWIGANAGSIASTFVGWVGQGLSWAVQMASQIPGKLADFLSAITGWVISNGPTIVTTFAGWVADGLQWLVDVIADIPGNLAGIPPAILSWVSSNGPKVVSAFKDLASKGVQWITDLVTSIPGKLGNIIGAITNWIADNGATIAGKFGDMATTIGKAFANAAAGLFIGAINTLIKAIDSVKIPSLHIALGPVSFDTPGWGGVGLGLLGVPSFDVGAWNLAHDTLAMLHAGEMVVPAAPASQMRGAWEGGSLGGGGDIAMHLHTHIYLDSKQIAENVDVRQGMRYLLSGTSRRRATGN